MSEDQGQLFEPEPLPQLKPWQGGFNLEEGKRLRDEAMSRVTGNTSPEYRAVFSALVRDFKAQGRSFTSEDITARIGFPPAAHPNAIGALTRSMAVRYGARKVGRIKAQRANQHATEIAIWGWHDL